MPVLTSDRVTPYELKEIETLLLFNNKDIIVGHFQLCPEEDRRIAGETWQMIDKAETAITARHHYVLALLM